MCSVLSRVRIVQRIASHTLRLRSITEGSTCAVTESRRSYSGLSFSIEPLRDSRRLYCTSMAMRQGLLFRQVSQHLLCSFFQPAFKFNIMFLMFLHLKRFKFALMFKITTGSVPAELAASLLLKHLTVVKKIIVCCIWVSYDIKFSI